MQKRKFDDVTLRYYIVAQEKIKPSHGAMQHIMALNGAMEYEHRILPYFST